MTPRHALNTPVYIILFKGQWSYQEGRVISISIVQDANGIHESYMIDTMPNVYWEVDVVYESRESIEEECTKRNTKQ